MRAASRIPDLDSYPMCILWQFAHMPVARPTACTNLTQSPVCPSCNAYVGGCGDARTSGRRGGGGGGGGALRMSVCLRGSGGGTFFGGPLLALVPLPVLVLLRPWLTNPSSSLARRRTRLERSCSDSSAALSARLSES